MEELNKGGDQDNGDDRSGNFSIHLRPKNENADRKKRKPRRFEVGRSDHLKINFPFFHKIGRKGSGG